MVFPLFEQRHIEQWALLVLILSQSLEHSLFEARNDFTVLLSEGFGDVGPRRNGGTWMMHFSGENLSHPLISNLIVSGDKRIWPRRQGIVC